MKKTKKEEKASTKKLTLRDYERRELLEKGAEKAFGGDESDEEAQGRHGKDKEMSYVEEQKALKDAFKGAREV